MEMSFTNARKTGANAVTKRWDAQLRRAMRGTPEGRARLRERAERKARRQR